MSEREGPFDARPENEGAERSSFDASDVERLRAEKAGAEAEARRAWEIVRQEAERADTHRIEVDRLLSEYDALALDVVILLSALRAITDARPNKPFDPWARGVANDALWNISEHARGMA